ncbi:MAG TPA: SET domain-containing protein-lysine N-methyltransferase [Chitinophagaceae bacterium]|nr:SET domain-containing protein-lysine N-methyltransferase [Chitinophagaceae bacterium]HNF71275.1 SET domain-containing protein-lysine N-methyltransferase [Chitinophagaceae bacterium]
MILESVFTALTEQKGWGVFTKEAIPADTLIEVSPVVVMSAKEKVLLDQTRLHDYIFHWQDEECCMATGLVPVYNHSPLSNCEYFQDYENGTISIRSVREIAPGEELCINYNGDFNNSDPVWFELSD